MILFTLQRKPWENAIHHNKYFHRWQSIHQMKRRGFSPYGPSKAALESASAIWAQELIEAHIRVNVLLPGGITNTGMLPASTPADIVLSQQARMLQPEIMQAPAVFLASDASQALTGRRLIATEWSTKSQEGRAIVEGIG
jgi:NAD(P)-dependent dehydrogenase (short-subunit alcohol dehydrogenase family)